MKAIAFALTLLLHFLMVVYLKLLDNFFLIISLMIASIMVGSAIAYSGKSFNANKRKIGTGIMLGALTSICIIIGFMIWLSFNFPK
jgi:VIT1/CCC1 family predicted Fe2+/Mn2+ transporter